MAETVSATVAETVSVVAMINPVELSTEDLERVIDLCGRELYSRQQRPGSGGDPLTAVLAR